MKVFLRTLLLPILLLLLFGPLSLQAQWRKLALYNATFFNEVYFVNANYGWIAQFNGTVIYTTDGGSNWLSGTLPGATFSSNRDLCFLSTSVGFCSGEDGIWKTTTGGASWTSIAPASARPGYSSSCWFIDANTGVWGMGSCADTTVRFYRTTNGGTSWDSVSYGHSPDVAVGGMSYIAGTFYANGGSGKFWSSTNNGASWSYRSTGSGGWQEDLISYGSTLWGASANGSSCSSSGGGAVLRSTNGGVNWTLVPFPTVVMWGVSMYSATSGWSCGDGGRAFRTADGGLTWIESDCGMNRADRVDDIHFTDSTHGWAVGDGIYKYVGESWMTRPDTIDFGDVLVGSRSVDSNAAIRSLGGNYTVTSRTLGGVDPTQFAATGSLGSQSILSCLEVVTPLHFQPTSVGVKIARLEYRLNGLPDMPVVYLKGRGVKPKLVASGIINFDTLRCGQDRIDSIAIGNEGTWPLVINSVNFSGFLSGSFQLIGPLLPMTIPIGGRTYIYVKASSSDFGAFSGMMSIVSNDPDSGKSPWNVRLTAFRQKIAVGFNLPDTVVLPPVLINSQSTGCILYTNIGNGIQSIEGLTALDLEPTITQAPITAGVRLIPGGQHGLCFSVVAIDTGLHVRRFRVRTQPCMHDTVITVIFRAINATVTSDAQLRVPIVCTDTTVEHLVLYSRGNAPLQLDTPSISGVSATEFTLKSPTKWPVMVAPGDSLVVAVLFHPALSGPPDRLATMTFATNDRLPGKSLYSVLLRGRRETSLLTPLQKTIALGDICLDQWSSSVAIGVRNAGSVVISSAKVDTLLGANITALIETPVRVGIPVSGVDSFQIRVQPHRLGSFVAQAVVSWLPCGRPDTVILTGRGVQIDLGSVPTVVDFGAVRPGVEAQRTIRVTNNGNIRATIASWTLNPPLPGLRIISPATPVVLDPGGWRDVVVGLNPADTGSISATLIALGDGVCQDTLSTPIVARATRASVVSDRFSVDFGRLSTCLDNGKSDTVRLTNSGDLPISVTNLRLARPTGSIFRLASPPSLPALIAPGATLVLALNVAPGLVGLARDTLIAELDQPELPRLLVPLEARRESTLLSVTGAVGNDSTDLLFDPLTSCSSMSQRRLTFHNGGTIPDTLDLLVSGSSFGLLGVGSRVIVPVGDSVIVPLRALVGPGTPVMGTDRGELRVVASPCDRQFTFSLETSIGLGASTVSDKVLGTALVGAPIKATAFVNATGNLDQRIESILLVQPDNDFQLDRDYRGAIVPAGGTLSVGLECVPSSPGLREAQVIVIYDVPCRDTVTAQLSANGLALGDRQRLVFESAPARARWGETVRLPIWIENPEKASFDSVRVSVEVAPNLLDISQVVAGLDLADGWKVDEISIDHVHGKGAFTLRRSDPSAVLPTTFVVAYLECSVLRGTLIISSIGLTISGLPLHVTDSVRNGDFALEDYCDAYGRLLRTDGTFALEQNAPNPFNPITVIEFETAFEGPVTLVLHDAGGREVLRLVDEVLPAGRRRVMVDGRDLPSGVYTYRLTSGLQAETRRMVLVK
jgi:photosystem II stability/assembly factor-like uncharacterized protein